MGSLILTLLRTALGRPPKLTCTHRLWRTGVGELRRRTRSNRESGAFLLGLANSRTRRIKQFLFYDDIDPTCFQNGIVEFDGRQFGKVWQRCRANGFTVVADVHVHPGGYLQSGSDKHNPMIAEVGHMAIIIPDYASRKITPGGIGLYEYRGSRQWINYSNQGRKVFHIGWWPK